MANTSFFPPILNDNIQIPQKIIHADQTATITSINDFTSLLDGPGRYIVETNSTSRTTLLSIGLIPANVSGILEVIRVDEAEYDYYLNYRGENNKRWFATMIMGICSVWQEAAIKSDLDALNSQITNLTESVVLTANTGHSLGANSGGKVGKLVSFFAEFVVTGNSGTWYAIGTVNFLPTALVEGIAIRTSNGSVGGMFQITTSGSVRFYPTQAFSNATMAFVASYLSNS